MCIRDRFHSLATTGREKDAVDVPGRQLGKALGQLDGGRVRVAPYREISELGGLACAGLGELTPAVARLDHVQP